MGNCGVGIAPCRPETREIAMRDLVNVEAIPFEVLAAGITWDWQSFPDYMDAAARRGSALNLAFLAPLTPLRHYVMGEASMERAAAAFVPAAHARDEHAQSLLLRGIPLLEARLRGQVEGGAGRGVPRSGVPQCFPRGSQAAGVVRQLGAHYAARGSFAEAEASRRAH